MDDSTLTGTLKKKNIREAGLSYKFQRLRESIRQAIQNGELNGKLPGERELAKRFHANTKTLGKALTDLAAEGLLDRRIGQGTFVKGSSHRPQSHNPWLILCDPESEQSPLVQLILQSNPGSQTLSDPSDLRPSLIKAFSAVIDMAQATPEPILRDLVVRNIPLVAVGREPRTYSTHCVLLDRALGAAHLGRDILLQGHQYIAAISPREDDEIYNSLLKTAARCAPEATVDRGMVEDLPALLQSGITALVCSSTSIAQQVQNHLSELNVAIPQQITLVAVGSIDDQAPCTGCFSTVRQEAETIIQALSNIHHHRPATFWMVGHFIDCGTSAGPTAQPYTQPDSILSGRGNVEIARTTCYPLPYVHRSHSIHGPAKQPGRSPATGRLRATN